MSLNVLLCSGFHFKDTVNHFQAVVPSWQSGHHIVPLLDDAIEFAERRQGGSSHPHDEVLVDEAVVLRVGIQLKHGPVPVHRLRCS